MERAELAPVVRRGVETLGGGGLLGLPTDTQYALAAVATQGAAIMRCYAIKHRSDDDPMPLLLPDLSWLDRVATGITPSVRGIAAEAWPGALTLVLPRNPDWRSLAAPGKTIAVRIPDHPVALAVLAELGEPLTGSSANLHGEPALTSAEAVQAVFGDEITVLPSLGVTPQGEASTILDCTSPEPRVVRAGALDEERIERLLAEHMAVPPHLL